MINSTQSYKRHLVRVSELIISIKEARKLLGKTAEKLSDSEVEKLILDLDFIARNAIKQFKELNQAS